MMDWDRGPRLEGLDAPERLEGSPPHYKLKAKSHRSRYLVFVGKYTLRCLALALKMMPTGPHNISLHDEKDLTFIGPLSDSARALRSLEASPYASKILVLRPEWIVRLIASTRLGVSLCVTPPEEDVRGVESDLVDSFEEGEIRDDSVLYNDECIKDCMEKNLEDDAGEILGVHYQGDCGNVTTDDNED
ncbi:5-oxoprolinase-like protein, partial [Tanacetum coccineum]